MSIRGTVPGPPEIDPGARVRGEIHLKHGVERGAAAMLPSWGCVNCKKGGSGRRANVEARDHAAARKHKTWVVKGEIAVWQPARERAEP